MLNTLIDLAKPGVWKDKLMIASEKLYDDDYKYIYLKAVVEVLSELDEELMETNYSGRLDDIRVDLCQKSQYVINTDSSEDHLQGRKRIVI